LDWIELSGLSVTMASVSGFQLP